MELNEFDNRITILYKVSNTVKTPAELILILNSTQAATLSVKESNSYEYDNYVYLIVAQFISDKLEGGSSAEDIAENLNDAGVSFDIGSLDNNLTKLNPLDFIFIVHRYYSEKTPDLNYYNELYSAITGDPVSKFSSDSNFESDFQQWEVNNYSNFQRDQAIYKEITAIQGQLDNLQKINEENPIQVSPLIVDTSTNSYNPKFRDKEEATIYPENGIDIFNEAVLNRFVPSLRYNDSRGKSYTKVFTGSEGETPDLDITVLDPSAGNLPNTLYLNLWLGDPKDNHSATLDSVTRESFTLVVYDLNRNFLSIKSPTIYSDKKGVITDPLVAKERVANCLVSLDLGEGVETRTSGDFDIWGMDYEEFSLLDMILLEPILNVFLYLEESSTPFAAKSRKRLDIHYRPMFIDLKASETPIRENYNSNYAAVSFILSQRQIVEGQSSTIFLSEDESEKINLPVGTPYLHINVSKAESYETLRQFIEVFKLLMIFHREGREPIIKEYRDAIESFDQFPALVAKNIEANTTIPGVVKVRQSRRSNNINELRSKAGELFGPDYSRACNTKRQPKIITPEEVENWRNRRQLLPYPPDNPRYYFVCPSEDYPYPGTQVSTKSGGSPVPCCFKKDQSSNISTVAFMTGEKVIKRRGTISGTLVTTRKILSPEQAGTIPETLNRILKEYLRDVEDDTNIQMLRYGSIDSPNSFLHCLCMAISDPEYEALPDEDSKEEYVNAIREYITSNYELELYKQELYDHSDEEIKDILEDQDRFFDPSLFFRVLEELYNVNIYVFGLKVSDENSDKKETGSIEVPRYKNFHARPLCLERPTILIMKMQGSESDRLEYPHCELIIDQRITDGSLIKVFGKTMTEICHSLLQQYLTNITFEKNLVARNNIYYLLDLLSVFPYKPVSQYVDNNGKLRVINFEVLDGKTLSIATIPSRPENLPFKSKLYRLEITEVQRLLGTPTAYSFYNERDCDGLWYKIFDIENGIYVPVKNFTPQGKVKRGPANPLANSDIELRDDLNYPYSIINRISIIQHTFNMIVQVIRWLFELFSTTETGGVEAFITKYFVLPKNEGNDSATFYDLSRLPHMLPLAGISTVDNGINALAPLVPTLCTGGIGTGKVIMYNDKFVYRMFKMLKNYDELYRNVVTKVRDIRQPTFLRGYYDQENIFQVQDHTKMFMNDKDLENWLNITKVTQNYNRNLEINSRIDISVRERTEPYLYKDADGKIYLVQNVVNGDLEKALQVADYWANNKVNLGIDPKLEDKDDKEYRLLPYVVYDISETSGSLVLSKNRSNEQTSFLSIVHYGKIRIGTEVQESRYGALLELL